MKLLKLSALGTGVMLAANAALAQTTTTSTHIWNNPGEWSSSVFTYDRTSSPKYSANEVSLDLFGSYVAGERRAEDLFKTNIRHGRWGGGVGLNYFFTRNIGIGGDINMSDNGGELVDQALGSLIVRFPIESCGLSPYLFGGGGRGIDPEWEWMGHAGAGLEWRMSHVTGIFADARYIWPDNTSDRILFRAGVRLAF